MAKPTRKPANERDLDVVWQTTKFSYFSTKLTADSAPKST